MPRKENEAELHVSETSTIKLLDALGGDKIVENYRDLANKIVDR